jgi:hypothetical protein
MTDAVRALLVAMRRHFARAEAVGGEIAAEAKHVLSAFDLPAGEVRLATSTHKVQQHLRLLPPEVLEGRFVPVAPSLPWRYSYAPRADAPGLEDNMAWAEIVGPEAPVHNDRVGFGLTFIGPHAGYLPHWHPAVELYNVVFGTADWEAEEPRAPRLAGAFILHRSKVPHAMYTDAEPMLAIYSWSGDIISPTAWT